MARGAPTKTVGHARAGGETALTVHYLGCCHQAVKTFEELRLWNDMIFVDVPKHRRLVGSQCGSRNVKVMPIFPPAPERRAMESASASRRSSAFPRKLFPPDARSPGAHNRS